MTIEQITAINNAMSVLTTLHEAPGMVSLEEFKEYIEFHIKALKDSGVDRDIIEHFKAITNPYLG